MLAAIGELEPGAHDEILDRARDEHLARPCEGSDARSDVDGDPFDARLGELDLAGVQTGP